MAGRLLDKRDSIKTYPFGHWQACNAPPKQANEPCDLYGNDVVWLCRPAKYLVSGVRGGEKAAFGRGKQSQRRWVEGRARGLHRR